ncbi:hypothetical protein BD560DRAFT_400302 [Blakeslea trispora]|nr:hypothetical protein BD560DRAFT_400302 [Blakeslea trispora]
MNPKGILLLLLLQMYGLHRYSFRLPYQKRDCWHDRLDVFDEEMSVVSIVFYVLAKLPFLLLLLPPPPPIFSFSLFGV